MKKVVKPWGHEIWFAHTDKYIGKLLFVKKGEELSLQYHIEKDETLYVLKGYILFTIGLNDTTRMGKGDVVHIKPYTVHRIKALRDSTIIEISTPEVDDVVRIKDKYGRAEQS